MMYCTGGIRCDVYSTFLRTKGFNNLFSLEGGAHSYFKEEGGDLWDGSLFVFDARLAVPPSQGANAEESLQGAIPCEICGNNAAVLPHNNCANVDCNKPFVACPSCKLHMKGCCCCEQCISAPRLLQPVGPGRNRKWGAYAQGTHQSRRKHIVVDPDLVVAEKAKTKEKDKRYL